MSALLARKPVIDGIATATTSLSDALKDLFSQIDTDGDGQLSKTEFEGRSAPAEPTSRRPTTCSARWTRTATVGQPRRNDVGAEGQGSSPPPSCADSEGSGPGGSKSDPLLQALQGASATSISNSDGSTTTSLTYADGSKVTMTSPATAAATSSYNFIEQLIAREARAISNSAIPSLSVSA